MNRSRSDILLLKGYCFPHFCFTTFKSLSAEQGSYISHLTEVKSFAIRVIVCWFVIVSKFPGKDEMYLKMYLLSNWLSDSRCSSIFPFTTFSKSLQVIHTVYLKPAFISLNSEATTNLRSFWFDYLSFCHRNPHSDPIFDFRRIELKSNWF